MKQPDLEIYILKPEVSEIHEWLVNSFDEGRVKRLAPTINSDHGAENMNHHRWEITTQSSDNAMLVILTMKVEKHFASLWFKQNNTQWMSDVELGRSIYPAIKREIRCSDSGWQEGQEETGNEGWIKINQRGENTFQWFT